MTTETSVNGDAATARPVHQIRFGRIIASCWSNDTQYGPMLNVTFQRVYRQNDELRYAKTFGRDDLPLLAFVANQAAEWLCQQSDKAQSTDENVPF